MNIPLIVIGSGLALFGLIKKDTKKVLTCETESTINESTQAQTVPSGELDELNETDNDSSDSRSNNLDDLGENQNQPE